jgi:GNAT superfamily N-acetyltransferase
MSIEVRPFRRDDREQLTALVNAHVAAVVPGLSVSVNTVLSHLERDPGEFIVDPWVAERATLVGEQRGRVVAAAHLLRYRSDDDVSESYRDSAEIRWFLFWPEAPYWRDSADAGEAVLAAAVGQLERWGVARQYADGTLPAPGVYGVPDAWPHVRAAYNKAGFTPERDEVVYVADVDDLPRPSEPPVEGLVVQRSLGINGTRLSAVLDRDVLGFIELEALDDGGRLPRHGGWADVGNLHIAEEHRRRGLARWLVGQAGGWLRLGRLDRVLAYAELGEDECSALYEAVGFVELARTARGWTRQPSALQTLSGCGP